MKYVINLAISKTNWIWILVFCLFAGLACQPKLEREGVPVIAGLSIDSAHACGAHILHNNLSIAQRHGLTRWMVDIPFIIQYGEGGQIFTYYEGHSLDTLVSLLKERKMQYGLNFLLRNPYSVFCPAIQRRYLPY